jgi:glycosyltransferase involved in cell wall biosynthesis
MEIRIMQGNIETRIQEACPLGDVGEQQSKTVYIDMVGQWHGAILVSQLLNNPPSGYRFVIEQKLTNATADLISGNALARSTKRIIQRVLPLSLINNYLLARHVKPPTGIDLTYSGSTAIFRQEPWVGWVEVATQLAGYNHHLLRRFHRVIERSLASANCRRILCQSEAAKRSLLRHLDADGFQQKCDVVHPGWILTPFRKPPKPKNAPVKILFVGASMMSFGFRVKGGLEALEAFAVLRKRYPNLELIVRSDVETSIRRRFEGFPGLRIIEGLLPYSELEALYETSDIYWYPAHYLMSVSVLEAMNYGLPIVTTDFYDNPEYVEDGQTGMIFPHYRDLPGFDTSEMEIRRALRQPDPEFVKALVDRTATLIENPELRRRMSLASRAAVEKRFSLEAKNARLKAALDRACCAPEAVRNAC